MAVRYCDKTIRRSNSSQRGSLLNDRSIAPPLLQNWFQCAAAAARVCAKSGSAPGVAFGANSHTSSIASASTVDVKMNLCGAASASLPPPVQRAETW